MLQLLFGIIGLILGSLFVYLFKIDMRIMLPVMIVLGVVVATFIKRNKKKSA